MSSYQPVWPEFELGWRLLIASVIGFLGAAVGSAGGVGGGGIYVPMLTLIIGFDPKSAAAMSKCMIMGAATSTVYYNLKQRHPSLDMPLIDYDLALLFQPMLMLGISIEVAFNIIFAEWMITILLIALFGVTSLRAISRGVDTWKKESLMMRLSGVTIEKGVVEGGVKEGQEEDTETAQLLEKNSITISKRLSSDPAARQDAAVPILSNIKWQELSLLLFVWLAFFLIQIVKTNAMTCSAIYWILNLLQVPIAVSVSFVEATRLYKGTRVIANQGNEVTDWRIHKLFLYCCCGILAGTIVGTLGLGGGFILTPLLLELGIPPQVASATSTFSMAFSSSMPVVQYYILKRFPVPYAAYLFLVAITAAFTGQHVVRKIIKLLGRASIIIFILSATILVSAFCLGGVGITRMIEKLENHEYMGFETFCH